MGFADIAAELRRKCADMPIDAASFGRTMARCALPDCLGMCCYDGVYVDEPTEIAIKIIVGARRPAFAAMGLDLPKKPIVDGNVGGVQYGRKTATRPWAGKKAVADFPAHFEQTCCIFRLDDGRCGLQVLALEDGLHPWAYKPSPCWLFPINIQTGVIKVFDETNDPSRYDAYKGFVAYTRCGQTCTDGRPAVEVFAEELRYLGDIVGRDLIGEIGEQG